MDKLTINEWLKIKSFEDLCEFVALTFDGKLYVGNALQYPTKTIVETGQWMIDKKYHKDIAVINRKQKILTFDSFHSAKTNKAGFTGLTILENANKIIDQLNSEKINSSYCKFYKLNDLDYKALTKYFDNIKDIFYSTEDDNSSYTSKWNLNCLLDMHRNEKQSPFNVFGAGGKNKAETLKILNHNKKLNEMLFKRKDLVIVSFMATKFNDNSLFGVIASI